MVPKKGADRTSRSDRKAHDNAANRAGALSVYFPDFRTMTPFWRQGVAESAALAR